MLPEEKGRAAVQARGKPFGRPAGGHRLDGKDLAGVRVSNVSRGLTCNIGYLT